MSGWLWGMRRGLVGVVASLAWLGCTPTGTPELVVTASPNSIRANGATTRVSVTATSAAGGVGRGKVNLRASAGSLKAGVDLDLDTFGAASAEAACDAQLDSLCESLPSLRVVATWSVTAEVRITINPAPPNQEASCANGVDDDEDGLMDCADPDCEAQPCDDRLACTVNELCASGTCTGGTPRSCVTPQNSLCALGQGTCDPSIGCVYPAQNVGLPCSDDSSCTINDRCDTRGRCTGERVVCDSPPVSAACHGPANCYPTRGCVYPVLHDGTSCGPREADRCCGGICAAIDESPSNCGGCGVVCGRSYCLDASGPAGCGPSTDVTGRCPCSNDTECPTGQSCLSGVCFPSVCKTYQTYERISDTCPAYCRY